MNSIFDTHAHYNDEAFDCDRDGIFEFLKTNGVCAVINCGTDIPSSKTSLRYAEENDFVFAACGIHPEDIVGRPDDWLNQIENLCLSEKCVAVGEIGLDYHRDTPRDEQKDVFEKQLLLANKLSKPVIVHDRQAHEDTLELIKKYRPAGVMHCFSGSAETAKELLKAGMYIGFGGSLTFKNAKKTVDVFSIVPLDRFLLETDCPYMAPVPFRGKRNDSTLIIYVAEKMSEISGMSTEKILNLARENAKRLFLGNDQ